MRDGRSFRNGARMAILGLVVGMGLLLSGDTGVHGAVATGIDPLEVLNLQVRNNALIVFDTSGSMRWPSELNGIDYGGDDPRSRQAQAKDAVKRVVTANQNLMNFGLASYNVSKTVKTLNDGGDAELRYATTDPDGALFEPYFRAFSNTWNDVDGTNVEDVARSFESIDGNNAPYPIGCTVGVDCDVYTLMSARFRHGVQLEWDLTATTLAGGLQNATPFTVTGTRCSDYPPVGLTFDNPDADGNGIPDHRRPWIKMVDSASGAYACYYLTGGIFENTTGNNCVGAAQLSVVAPCTGNNAQLVLNEMGPEMPIGDYLPSDDFGLGLANAAVDLQDRTVPVDVATPAPPDPPTNIPTGLRTGQSTPIAGSLDDIRTASPPYFPPDPTGGQQKNFVLFLTDGDDTCAGGLGDVTQAAFDLYNNGTPTNQAELIFIAFTNAVNLANAHLVARAGSGGNSSGVCGTSPNGPCRDAFLATNTDELVVVLQNALEIAVASGTFSASPGIVSTVFELGVANGADPLDPDTRYNDRSNALYIPLFNLPNWDGELVGFRNDGTASPILVGGTTPWNAGQSLIDNIATPMNAASLAGRPAGRFTFSELHGGADARNIGTSAAQLKRRVFTSAGGGRFLRTGGLQYDSSDPAGSNVVALWPPTQTNLSAADNTGTAITAVDPVVGTAGSLDDALGIGAGSSPVLTFTDLRAILGACRSSADLDPQNGNLAVPVPTPCTTNDIDYARKEARQILLAWAAGAQLIRGTDTLPLRNGVAGAEFGELLYEAKPEFMYDSTLSQPAVMTPPLGATTQEHAREWILYRDGHRNASREGVPGDLDLGFGLRNPDFDDTNPQSKLTLKPRMSVIFYGTNLFLHALNAATAEELWAYLPFDQLGRPLEYLRNGQTRNDHIYSVATSLRIADIFVPGSFTEGTFTFEGRWRTVLVFGRGPGGKHLTAIDVTAPGPFTRPTLQTNPPWVMWQRGNPDVDLAGNAVRTADTFPYQQMGETWSLPAIGNIDTTTIGPPEWRMWVGSGYTDDAGDGRTFYELDAVSGDVLYSQDVDAIFAATPGQISANALVASPAAYNSFQLDPPGTLTRGPDLVSRVFVPDLHGRIWKYLPGTSPSLQPFYNAGVTQPFTEAVALSKLNAGDFVYAGSGRDTRADVFPFKIFGIEDVEGDGGNTAVAGTLAFSEDYPDIFRNRTQPAVAFNAGSGGQVFGRVFFVGQRFNPVSASCITSFDALLFALGAETGAYVYDFDGGGADAYTITTGKAPGGLSVQGGRVEVPGLGGATSPTPFTTPSPSAPEEPQIVTHSQTIGSPVCRN